MKTYFLSSTLLLGLFAGGCGGKNESPSQEIVKDVARQQASAAKDNLKGLKSSAMKGATLSGGDAQGRPLWSVSADNIQTTGDLTAGTPKQAVLTNAKATLFRAGKPESNLQATRMTLFNTGKGIRLQMTQSVKGESVGPWTGSRGVVKFTAPRADVDVQTRVISASGGVSMSQGATQVVAQQLRSQTALRKVDVSGKVRGTGENGQVEAQSATYDWEKSKLTAQKVVASQQGTKISGDSLEANTQASQGTLIGRVMATSEQGTANAPRLDFDWKKDHISANNADFSGKDGKMRASRIETDSKLRVASATGLIAEKDGATLRVASADGFDGLSRISGRGVSFTHNDLTLMAPHADASKQGSGWVLVATGGARGRSASGNVSASRVTWDEGRGRVLASGGVTLEKDGATLSGATLNSDTKFNLATLTGNVRGRMKDGFTLNSGTLEKRGERFIASQGATARFNSKGALGALTMKCARIEAAADGSEATATGSVTVTSATGATARAPRATYNRKTGKVIATGGVDFYDPVRGLRQHGDTLTADLGLKEARLTNTRGQVKQESLKGIKLF